MNDFKPPLLRFDGNGRTDFETVPGNEAALEQRTVLPPVDQVVRARKPDVRKRFFIRRTDAVRTFQTDILSVDFFGEETRHAVVRKRGDFDRLNRLEIGCAVKQSAAAPLRVRRTDDVVAVLLRKVSHAAVDGMKIEVTEFFVRIHFKNRLFADCEV